MSAMRVDVNAKGLPMALQHTRSTAIIAASMFLLTLTPVAWAQKPVSPAFTIPQRDLIPEGIAYDARRHRFFISSTYRRKIVSVDSSGEIADFTQPGENGMWGVLGMKVDERRRRLWVVSSHAGDGMPMQDMAQAEEGSSAVHVYDVDDGRLIRKYVLSGVDEEHFLNDLVVTPAGEAFITDSGASVIWSVAEGTEALRRFLDLSDFGSPNGIALSADGQYLYVALWGDRDLVRVSMANRETIVMERPDGMEIRADGLYFHDNSLVSIEPFSTSKVVNRYFLDKDGGAVVRHEVLVADHPLLVQPTTGVIVDDTFFFIANSQMQYFRRLYAEFGGDFPQENLQDVVIASIGL